MTLRVYAVVATILSASPALAAACRFEMPPLTAQRPVSEPVTIYYIPNEKMAAQCNKVPNTPMGGCAIFANSKHHALIFLNAGMAQEDLDCMLIYEEAHLKPNNWYDPIEEAKMKNLPGLPDVSTLYPPAPIPMPRPAGRD